MDFLSDQKKCIQQIKKILTYPMFIKPGTGGSSIGVSKAKSDDELTFGIEVASSYSEKIIVEESFENISEVNCSALGYEKIKASVCEMPKPSSDILSFADKYQNGETKGGKSAGMASLSRIIPAPISETLTKQIQETTIKVFKAIDGCGVARIDYFVDVKRGKFWINEINSPPGSFAFYLWNKSGIDFPELLEQMIQDGVKRFENQKKTQYTFESNLLSDLAHSGGIK